MKVIKALVLSLVALTMTQVASAQMSAAMKLPINITVNGKIEGAGNVKVTLQKVGEKGIFAETTSKNGVFKINVKKSTLPYPFKLTIGNKSMIIMLETGECTITGKISDLKNAKIQGLSSQDEYMELQNALAKCTTEIEKSAAMENFMSVNTHSWVSLYLLELLYIKNPKSTQKMRMLMGYVKHFNTTEIFKKIDAAITAVEASEE